MDIMKRTILSLALSALACAAVGVTPVTFDYAVVDGDTLRMDVYMPASDAVSPRPAVIFAFGGGFTGGSRDNAEYREYFDFLADNGVVVISTDYRTTLVSKAQPGQLGSAEGFTKAMVTAVGDAVTDFYTATGYVLGHADGWNVDPGCIIASGSSAGAITALQAEYGLVNGEVPAGFFPEGFNYAAAVTFAGAICCGESPVWAETPCPMMLFHGDADRNVPFATLSAGPLSLCGSKTIALSLEQRKVPCEFYTFAGADHSVAISPMHGNLYAILGFIRRVSEGKQKASLNAVEFVAGAPTDYQTTFSIADYMKANM